MEGAHTHDEPVAAPRRRPRRRNWLFALFVVLSIFPLVNALARTTWGIARIRDAVSHALRTELGLDARFHDLYLDLAHLEVVAEDIELAHPRHGPLARAGALRIRPAVLPLLRGKLALARIDLRAPTVFLVVRDGIVVNVPDLGGGGDTPTELPFDVLRATHASVRVDAEPVASGKIEALELEVRKSRPGRFVVSLETSRGEFMHARGVESLRRLAVDVEVDPARGVAVDRAELDVEGLRVQVEDGFVPLPFGPGLRGSVEASLDVGRVVERLGAALELPDVRGQIELEATAAWGEDGPRGEGKVRLAGARIDEFGLGDEIALDLEVKAGVARAHGRATVVKGGGQVGIDASVGLDGDLPLEADIAIEHLEFAKLMDQLGVSENAIVQWTIDGSVHLTGTLAPLDFSGPLHIDTRDFLVSKDAWHERPIRPVLGVPTARLDAVASVRPDGLRFEGIRAVTPRSRLRADVLLGFDNVLAVDVDASRLDLVDISPLAGFSIGGAGRAGVRVRGTFSDPTVEGELEIGSFTFHDFRFGDVAGDARLEKEGLAVRFPTLRATKHESRYVANDVFLDFTGRRFAASANVELVHMTLADFYHVFRFDGDERFESYLGDVEGRVDVRYTQGYAGDGPTGTMIADVDVAVPRASLNEYAFTDGRAVARWTWLDFDRGYQGGRLELEHAELHKGRGTVVMRGAMELGGALQLTLAADRVDVADTEGMNARLPGLRGTYGILGEIRGTAAVPRAYFDVAVQGLTWQGEYLGDGRAYVRLTDLDDPWLREGVDRPDAPCRQARRGLAEASWPADPPLRTSEGPRPALEKPMAFLVCGAGLDDHLRFDLALGRTKVVPLRGSISFDALALEPFLPRRAVAEGVRGRIGGSVQFDDGGALAPETLEARVILDELFVGQDDVEMRNQGRVDVSLARGGFRIARARFRGPSTELRITGSGTPTRLATRVEGALDLGLLATLSPRVDEARGRLLLRADLSGPFVDPSLDGTARIEDANFRFASFPEPIRNLTGTLRFNERRIVLEELRADVAGGAVALEGRARIADRKLVSYELGLHASDLFLSPSPGVELGFGGDAKLSLGREDALPLLDGVIRIDRLVYTKPVQLAATLDEISRRTRTDVEGYDPDADKLRLDLRFVQRSPFRVTNNLVDAQVRIDESERPFRVVGTDQRFGVLGRLSLSRGIIRFRNSEFAVRRGVIDFDDAARVQPNFDVRATTEVRRTGDIGGPTWRITLHAHGTPDSFRLDTTSEPQLAQEDVVLLLTMGMTRAEAEQLQTGDLTGVVALEALSAVTGVDREVRRAVPVIDEFSLSSTYSTTTQGQTAGTAAAQVTIGKRVTDRLRLRASTGLAEQRQIRAGMEFQLDERTSVQVVYDNLDASAGSSLGNLGADLRWRLEFE